MLNGLSYIPSFFLRPVRLFQTYDRADFRPDLIAGLTVAIVLLPQAIAYAMIAELPPQVGLYTAVVAAIVGGLWGSSNHLHTGPTNTVSLLVLSILSPIVMPGSPEFIAIAGLMAIMVGIFRLTMGLARLGMLVNFVSDSVIVGFMAGAGILIGVNQVRHLLRLEFPSFAALTDTIQNIFAYLPEAHWPSLGLGLGVMLLIILLRRFSPKLPSPLIGIILASVFVWLLDLDQQGVKVVGELPRGLPPLTKLPRLNINLIGQLSTGVLAVGMIGLVEAMSIARSIASQTGQRLDSNQEFVGQGLASMMSGFFSGYTTSGSFVRSAVNYTTGAKTPLAGVFSGLMVLLAMLVLAPLAVYIPRTALAGILIVTAAGMIDRREMVRIWHGARGDAIIMVVTLLATLLLPLEFAVLTGILFSLARYLMKTSEPKVQVVLPDSEFKHILPQPSKEPCPQLGIVEILGDLYFGAVNHVEYIIHKNLAQHSEQRFLLLRMHSVNHCDISGIHMLETLLRTYRERGGDLFLTQVREPVHLLMKSTGFYDHLGADHFLPQDEAISHIFYKILDPAICIYECNVRAFKECQNLPKQTYQLDIPLQTEIPPETVADISPQELWQKLCNGQTPPMVIDVREPREFKRGHIPEARLIPLPEMLSDPPNLPDDQEIVFVCRGGRRSTRVTHSLQRKGYQNVRVLRGGMLAWEAAGLLQAVEL
jgi:SulP family sulfate permease